MGQHVYSSLKNRFTLMVLKSFGFQPTPDEHNGCCQFTHPTYAVAAKAMRTTITTKTRNIATSESNEQAMTRHQP